jgi:short-subunit dehydrogenase
MTILITGASKGIGKAIAEKFAAEGHDLLLCARNEVNLYQCMADLQTRFPAITIRAKAADLSDSTQTKAFGRWVTDNGFNIDVLVNNAGQFLPGSIYNEADGLLETMINVNLYSAYHLTRTLLPAMMERRSGYIFNICSIASLQAYPNGGAYSISKFALLGFSRNLREEMKPYNIKVTALCPGATMSASWEGFEIDPKRIMEATDIAKMIWAATQLSEQAVVEDIVLRPQLGDL